MNKEMIKETRGESQDQENAKERKKESREDLMRRERYLLLPQSTQCLKRRKVNLIRRKGTNTYWIIDFRPKSDSLL